MGKIIRDLWIIANSGIVIYHRKFSKDKEHQFFGGFISAWNEFSENLMKEGLYSFELSDNLFTLRKQHDFIFVANSSNSVEKHKLDEELHSIVDKFFEMYLLEDLKHWSGDVRFFENFESNIKDSLESVDTRFKSVLE